VLETEDGLVSRSRRECLHRGSRSGTVLQMVLFRCWLLLLPAQRPGTIFDDVCSGPRSPGLGGRLATVWRISIGRFGEGEERGTLLS
jgi:hypothetical protein